MPYDCDTYARDTRGRPTTRKRARRCDPRMLKKLWSECHGEEWPDGMQACHTCDEPRCSNPAHIFPGTQSDNITDGRSKGRVTQGFGLGEDHHNSKLSLDAVQEIRERVRTGERQRLLAREYGVHQSAISKIVHGKLWSHAGGGQIAV